MQARQLPKRGDISLPPALAGALTLALRGVSSEQQKLIHAIMQEAVGHERDEGLVRADRLRHKLSYAAVGGSQQAIRSTYERVEQEQASTLEAYKKESEQRLQEALRRHALQAKAAQEEAVQRALQEAKVAAEARYEDRKQAIAIAVERAIANNNQEWSEKLDGLKDQYRLEVANEAERSKEQAVHAALAMMRESNQEQQRDVDRLLHLTRVECEEKNERALRAATEKASQAHEEHLRYVTETITRDAARATQDAVREAVHDAEIKALRSCKAQIAEATCELKRENAALRAAVESMGMSAEAAIKLGHALAPAPARLIDHEARHGIFHVPTPVVGAERGISSLSLDDSSGGIDWD